MSTLRAGIAALSMLAGLVDAAHAFDSVGDGRTWALTGVRVIDVATGAVQRDQAIVVHGGVIESVGPTATADLAQAAPVIDEHGRYAMPGLWDMHVHLRGGPALEAANERWLSQYLAFGITTVRDAGGDLPDAVLRWKRAITRGDLEGPRIFTSLRKIDGPQGAWAGSIPVTSAVDVRTALDRLEAAGADFIKVYDGSISPAMYLETLAEAERRGLRTAAHVPLSVPFEDAIDAGLDSVEHAFHLVKAANPNDRSASKRFARTGVPEDFEPFFVAVSELGEAADETHARRVFRKMAARGTALTPTIYIRRAWNRIGRNSSRQDTARRFAVPPKIRATYAAGIDILAHRTTGERAHDLELERASIRLTRLAADEGVMILAGSDTGASNPRVYPGDSLHQELATLVDAGLTPLRALQAATINPARWFGKTDEFGAIAEGEAADLLILDASPLEDIENTRSIVAIVQQGVYFDRDEVEKLKDPASAD
jgi:imidazolonepropionase-like amidohydrolase